ncbi:hypothetical protein BD309DRAFT_547869 [Dichomitus squalens]|nr:hypothetical protein BD309DRAFT_547869 [Dichomitus squalens]
MAQMRENLFRGNSTRHHAAIFVLAFYGALEARLGLPPASLYLPQGLKAPRSHRKSKLDAYVRLEKSINFRADPSGVDDYVVTISVDQQRFGEVNAVLTQVQLITVCFGVLHRLGGQDFT